MERLALALSLEKRPEPIEAAISDTSADDDFGEYDLADETPAGAVDNTRAAMNALRSVATDVESLRWHLLGLRALAPRL